MFLFVVLFLNVPVLTGEVLTACVQTEYAYIMGDYEACVKTAETQDIRCKYIKALCEIGSSDYDKARFLLSVITTDVKEKKMGLYNAAALNSLTELAFLTGSYKKAARLAPEVNSLLSRELPDSYPYLVSELLFIKSRYDSRDLLSAFRRIQMLKGVNTDGLLFDSLNTEAW
ncbi:MAG: hypothetical protein JXA66_02995 [Oligoflexia bacterium]|nr:hypothetical protein [Oligoflexia bacterium]